jgi:hypothetical protein
METFKVTFDNGDSIVSSINGTDEEIKAYYNGTFNIESGELDLWPGLWELNC